MGDSCAGDNECGTGHCADGHCCNTACSGTCLSCTTGTCTTVKNAEDPDTCGGLTMCDATGVCATRITSFTYPTVDGSRAIVSRTDGTLCFVESAGVVGRVTASTGAITEVNPHSPYGDSSTIAMAQASDGTMWFIDSLGDAVVRINPQGQFAFFSLASLGVPAGVAVRGTSEIWVPIHGDGVSADHIVRLDATTAAVLASFPLPAKTWPRGIVLGPDGNFWFTEYAPPGIGRLTPSGQVTSFPMPAGMLLEPVTLAVGPDGALWFGGNVFTAMGRITTDGAMTFYSARELINTIVLGPDGNLWYTGGNNTLATMSTAGVATLYKIPGANPSGLAAGPDGNIWFTDSQTNVIRRFKLK
jgi:streptogramin lyase